MRGQIRSHGPGDAGFALVLVKRAIVLVALAAFFGGISIFINPASPRYGEDQIRKGEVPLESVVSNADVLWVDARDSRAYLTSHVKGALLINEDDYYKQIGAFLDEWKEGRIVVVYCSSHACPSAANIARRIRLETDATQVYSLYGGWERLLNSKAVTIETGVDK
ncbi:MAG: rhodanese-like domain-containing protein [Opitutales bacterium]|jgi:rhodanese-related sulfurtransferase